MLSLRLRRPFIVLLTMLLLVGIVPLSMFTYVAVETVWAAEDDERVLLFEDDAIRLNDAGWTPHIAPEDGVYIIDSTLSLGNPNGIVTKPVEVGQYLFYGDHRASPGNRFNSISKKLPIGSEGWMFEFRAKFVDLIKPNLHHAYRGISFEIYADGKEYKLSFIEMNKILAMIGTSGAYLQQEVNMPTDDEFHWWEISFDGRSTVSVKVDGQSIAEFENIAIPVPGRADELKILNAPLNWESGTNEVYIDHMKLYRTPKAEEPPEEKIDDGYEAFTANDYIQSDLPPETTPIVFRNYSAAVALDYMGRSVGADLGSIQELDRLQLWNRGSATRVKASDYSVYVSNDNSAYTLVTDWTLRSRMHNNRLIHEFIFDGTQARYVKIRTSYTDTAFTFIIDNPQVDIRVFVHPQSAEGLSSLTQDEYQTGSLIADRNGTTGQINIWGIDTAIQLDQDQTSLGFDLGAPERIGMFQMTGLDATSELSKLDYLLYYSQDNENYSLIPYWTFNKSVVDDRMVHSFVFYEGLDARYLKIQAKSTAISQMILQQPHHDVTIYTYPGKVTFALDRSPLSGAAMYLDYDPSPEAGTMEDRDDDGLLPVDVNHRSIGMDLGRERLVQTVQLWNEGLTSHLGVQNVSLYISKNNDHYYPVDQWEYTEKVQNGRLVQQFDLNESEIGRYVKVHVNQVNHSEPAQFVQLYKDLKIYSDSFASPIQATSGYLDNDTSPISGSIEQWGLTKDIHLDIEERSIGLRLQDIRRVGRIELHNVHSSSRVGEANYRIYQSDDNLYYRRVNDWNFFSYHEDSREVHMLQFANLTGKYVKITTDVSDDNGTFFLSDIQQDLRVFSAPVVTPLVSKNSLADGRDLWIDLGIQRRFSKLELQFSDQQHVVSADDVRLFYSVDGEHFEQITHWAIQQTEADYDTVQSWEFDGIYARYLKVIYEQDGIPVAIPWIDLERDVQVYAVTGVGVQNYENTLPVVIGYVSNDRVPELGIVTEWGYGGDYTFDTTWNSIVADLGQVREFNRMMLFDDDHDRRLQKPDLSLYVSDDNVTYTKVDQWDLKQVDHRMEIYNLDETARYVKVHQHFRMGEHTMTALGGSLQAMMFVAYEPAERWTFGGHGQWRYKKPVTIHNDATEIAYDRAVFIDFDRLGIDELVASGKVGAALHDIRFARADGQELHYYIADEGFHVRIPELAPMASKTIWMYYGNPNAEAVSDGLNTFQAEYGNRTIEPWGGQHQSKPIQLLDGRLMEVFDRSTNIYVHFSKDDGKTWGSPALVADLGGSESMGSALQLSNGDMIVMFFKYGQFDRVNCLSNCLSELYMSRSTDLGATWHTPVKVDTGWNYNVTYSNPIELDNGDIVAPFHYAYTDDGAFRQSVMYSIDQGYTWTKSVSDIETPGTGFEVGATEGAVVQLADGTLKMFYRAQTPLSVNLGESVSTDRGRIWSEYSSSPIYAANTMPAMTRDDERIYLLWGGNNAFGGTSYMRAPFNLAYSDDETASWKGYRDLLVRTAYHATSGTIITQPDFALTAHDSAMIVWAHDAWGSTDPKGWTRMRITDFEKYLTRSHGGFSGFDSPDLINNHWWIFSADILWDPGTKYSGVGALKYYDANPNQLAEALRSFGTGIVQGTVSTKIYPEQLDSGFVLSLKESYSRGLHTPGTVFQLYTAPDGSLHYGIGDGTWNPLPGLALTKNQWNDVEIHFNTAAYHAEIVINGVSAGEFSYNNEGMVINYLHVSAENATVSGTTVYLDELIVQDTSVPLPNAGFVGHEEHVLDVTVPEILVNMITADGQLYVNNTLTYQSVTASVYATDLYGAIDSFKYSLDQGVTWTDYVTELQLNEHGIYSLWVRAVDSAGNVAQQRYTILIGLEGSADLREIWINDKIILDFDPAVEEYTLSVGNNIKELMVTVLAQMDQATMELTVNDEAAMTITSGVTSIPIDIHAGYNQVQIELWGEDGLTGKTYTIHVMRAAPQADDDYRGPNKSDLVDLSELLLSDGLLQPEFSPKHRQYKVDVGSTIQSITVTAATYHSDVTMTVNGVNLESGATSDPIQLEKGKTDIDIVITARNGLTRTYSIHVFRKKK